MAACRISMTKRCSKCRVVKPLSEFTRQAASKCWHKTHCHCKDCNRTRQQHYRDLYRTQEEEKRPWERWRHVSKADYLRAFDSRTKFLRAFNLSLEDYFNRVEAQKASCAICKRKVAGRNLAIDHCHITGAIRGLLCDQCNRGIGFLGDTAEAVERALQYLRSR